MWHLSAGLCKPVSVKTFRPLYTSIYVFIQGNTSVTNIKCGIQKQQIHNHPQHGAAHWVNGERWVLGESSTKPLKASSLHPHLKEWLMLVTALMH